MTKGKSLSSLQVGTIAVLAITAICILLVYTTPGIITNTIESNDSKPYLQLRWERAFPMGTNTSTPIRPTITRPLYQKIVKREEVLHRREAIKSLQCKNQTTPQAHTERAERKPETGSEVESSVGCLANGDCGLGYACYEGRCKPGCSKHQDCLSGYECLYGRYGYRCFEKTGWHRECREHLRVCSRHLQCCSGRCAKGKGGDMLCRSVV